VADGGVLVFLELLQKKARVFFLVQRDGEDGISIFFGIGTEEDISIFPDKSNDERWSNYIFYGRRQ
jgi:hypothetical protein